MKKIKKGSKRIMPLTIEEYMKSNEYDYAYVLQLKEGVKKDFIDADDKKHIRLIATLEIARIKPLFEKLLNSCYSEKFIFDKEKRQAIYLIKIHRRKEKIKYAHC